MLRGVTVRNVTIQGLDRNVGLLAVANQGVARLSTNTM
jgi:hypothetical protein